MPTQDPPDLNDFEDLFENAPCGYVSADKHGRILRANATLAGWIGAPTASLSGQRFSSLLTVGGKLFYETHLAPMLRMQGAFSEAAVDLACSDGRRLPTLVSAVERRDAAGAPQFVRITIFSAQERRRYERELMATKTLAEGDAETQRAAAELREQFIAVLGHDLRNPLASIASGVRLLGKETLTERGRRILPLMQGSVLRASTLVDNVLDLARSRLGGGIGLSLHADAPVAAVIAQVVDELRSVAGADRIEATLKLEEPVEADEGRLGQLLSNLLANALTHGAQAEPVRLDARTLAGVFEVSVSNAGAAIPPATMANLFQPFFRGAVRPQAKGLGLGLHIASEIASAHGGRISVASDDHETCFTFRMPCRQDMAAVES